MFRLVILLIFISIFFTQYVSHNNHITNGKNGAVVCSSPEAAQVGIEILKKGGNAYDATVAVAFAMAVTYPQAGNIGGGGFIVSYSYKGDAFSLDFREKAPALATRDMYLDKGGVVNEDMLNLGVTAAGVPGSVAGLFELHKQYGTMKWADLLAPAIKLAKKGFNISYFTAYSFNSWNEELNKMPERFSTTRQIFSNKNKFNAGDLFIQKDLAKTLEVIAAKGRDGFYKGPIAKLIVDDMLANKGFITQTDLETYQPVKRELVRFDYRGLEVLSMAPPSSGGVALYGILKTYEKFDISTYPYGSAKQIQLMVEICRQVYADRSEFLGDPDFVNVPMKNLLSSKYTNEIKGRVVYGEGHLKSSDVKPLKALMHESIETTHFNIYDKFGNAVSMTTTLNNSYGSYYVINGAGFIINNEMDDFSAKAGVPNSYGLVGSVANEITGNKRMLSSMTPTIVLKDGKPFLIVGSPGGSTIITTVAQAIIRVVEYKMNIDEAVNLPRFHHQWLPDEIKYEKRAIGFETLQKLKNWNYDLNEVESIGDCHAIMIENGLIMVGTSNRGNGASAVY